jgi:hypothetical protein
MHVHFSLPTSEPIRFLNCAVPNHEQPVTVSKREPFPVLVLNRWKVQMGKYKQNVFFAIIGSILLCSGTFHVYLFGFAIILLSAVSHVGC